MTENKSTYKAIQTKVPETEIKPLENKIISLLDKENK